MKHGETTPQNLILQQPIANDQWALYDVNSATVEGLWNLLGQLLDQFPRERSAILSHLQHGSGHLALSRDTSLRLLLMLKSDERFG